MFDYTRSLEALCRSLPEIIAGVSFAIRRRNVDTKYAESLLAEFNIHAESIQNQRALINDLVDFEGVKRDWDSALLMCILSYIVLGFSAPIKIIVAGISIWVLAFVIVKLRVSDEGPGARFRSRRLIIRVSAVIFVTSIAGKIASVFVH